MWEKIISLGYRIMQKNYILFVAHIANFTNSACNLNKACDQTCLKNRKHGKDSESAKSFVAWTSFAVTSYTSRYEVWFPWENI